MQAKTITMGQDSGKAEMNLPLSVGVLGVELKSAQNSAQNDLTDMLISSLIRGMTTQAKPKIGRKQKPYVASWGEHVNGLRRRQHDGRWILLDGRAFTEHDERRAVERFRAMVQSEVDYSAESLERMTYAHMGARLWRYVAEEIRNRPQWVAEQTGIEQIGYLRDLKAPEVLPTFAKIELEWKTHFKKSAEQKRRVLHAFADFEKTSGISDLNEITPDVAIAYRDNIYARNPSKTYSATEFDGNGQAVQRIDFAGRSEDTLPHEHPYDPNTKGFGPKQPLNNGN